MWSNLLFGHINEAYDDNPNYNSLLPILFKISKSGIGGINTEFNFKEIDFDNISIHDNKIYQKGSNLLFEIISESPCDTIGIRKLIIEVEQKNQEYHLVSAYFVRIIKKSNVEFRYILDSTYHNKIVVKKGKLIEIDIKTKLSNYKPPKGGGYLSYESNVYFSYKEVPFMKRAFEGVNYYRRKYQILQRCPKGV